jgi:hypothetical protein
MSQILQGDSKVPAHLYEKKYSYFPWRTYMLAVTHYDKLWRWIQHTIHMSRIAIKAHVLQYYFPLPTLALWDAWRLLNHHVPENLWSMQHKKNKETRIFESVHFRRFVSSKINVTPTNNVWQSEKQMSLCLNADCLRAYKSHAHNRPQGPKGVPGRLRPRIFLTFGTTRVVGREPHAPAAFTPRRNPWYSFLEAESTPGHMVLSVAREKIPSVTPPGIDPETVWLVAQYLNHYAIPGPYMRIKE